MNYDEKNRPAYIFPLSPVACSLQGPSTLLWSEVTELRKLAHIQIIILQRISKYLVELFA